MDLLDEGIMTDHDISQKVSGLEVPTLLVIADHDHITLPSEGKKLSKAIKTSQVAEMKGCGHFMHLEKPKLFIKIVRSFIGA